ncbi:N-acetylmuramoyl-L-alanine amidase [Sandaracinobacter sp.]|uniref:N-acetylmuramoyl-L-alanine amidase n=1 Tax=Sandaracinobacter sp. TaxID=2487581 RepID=UPI0035B4BAAF
MRRLLVLLLLLLLPAAAHATAVAGNIRVLPTAEGATVRLALSEPLAAPPRAFALADPMRWAIDLGGASSVRREVAATGDVKAARVSQFDPETVRIVVDLGRPMQLAEVIQDRGQVLELRFRPVDEAAYRRLVSRGRSPVGSFYQEAPRAVPPGPAPPVDIAADSAARIDAVEAALADASRDLQPAPPPPAVQPRPPIDPRLNPEVSPRLEPRVSPPPKATPAPLPPATASARKPRAKRAVIVIDAGHGGHDPGAPSVIGGGSEKDVTLAIAQQAKARIERRAREKGLPVEVRLTRDRDYFVTLGNRVRLARDWKADLFISVHADSAPNPLARGASVYTLSETASDREAARVAAKENRADLIAGVDLRGENREVASILVDLGMRDSMNASADFAEALQNGMEPEGVVFRSQFHRFANFQVLRNLGVAAVLLETGFLSNEEDARYLMSSKGQRAIADGIAESVVAYIGKR